MERIEFARNLYNRLIYNKRTFEGNYEPIKAHKFGSDYDECLRIGNAAILQNKLAVVTLAGGDGSRLGADIPKGMYDIGLVSRKSFLQIQCERLQRLNSLTGGYIHWYIMTSESNHMTIMDYFAHNDYFGYRVDKIRFFRQDVLPLMHTDGKTPIMENDKVVFGGTGSGGCYRGLIQYNLLEKMSSDNIEYIFFHSIDNALVRIADPAFLGFTIKSGCDVGAKVVKKRSPDEKAGLVCRYNGIMKVVEYMYIPDDIAGLQHDGELVYDNCAILNYIVSVSAIKKLDIQSLQYQMAKKSVVIGGKRVDCLKFELFIFDAFDKFNDIASLMVDRSEEFAPVKNSVGEDSPQSAREMIYNLHKRWLKSGGFTDGFLHDKNIEISPLISYSGEGITLDIVDRLDIEHKSDKTEVDFEG